MVEFDVVDLKIYEKKEEFNIFNQPKKDLGKKSEKPSALGPLHPPKTAPSSPAVGGEPASNFDAMETLNKMKAMDDDLQKKMDQICELCGMSRGELKVYLENPQNFQSNRWIKVQSLKEQLEEKIYGVLGIEQKKKDIKKKKTKLAKDRKGKTLGGRKGWIQM